MILLHAMAAPRDIPGIGIQRGDTMFHLLSDRPGFAGTAELLALVRACGGMDSWVQSPGTYREHFDIFGEWAERARAMGAIVAGDHAVGQALAHKRAAMGAESAIAPAVTSRQMRVVDDLAIAAGLDLRQMMELAGARLVDLTRRFLGGSLAGRRVVVLAGAGNNGGGGLVAARHATNAGARVTVWLAAIPSGVVPAGHLEMLRGMGVPVHTGVAPTLADLAECDIILDALLGYGARGAPRDLVAEMIMRANAAGRLILALDLPSGLDPDDAGPFDPCITATATMTLALPKRGLTLERALPVMGDLYLADIGIAAGILKEVSARVGALFATGAIVRLRRTPLAGDLLPSPIGFWRVADENNMPGE